MSIKVIEYTGEITIFIEAGSRISLRDTDPRRFVGAQEREDTAAAKSDRAEYGSSKICARSPRIDGGHFWEGQGTYRKCQQCGVEEALT